jgi:hypothetical protein
MMKGSFQPTQVQPGNARLVYSFRLKQSRRAFWGLNIGSALLLVFFGWFFLWYLLLVRPDFLAGFVPGSVSPLILFLMIVASYFIALGLHELIHGVFLWVFTHKRPVFGFLGWYAYAAAPGWFFPRRRYLVIILAPFVFLSVLGLILLAFLPARVLFAVLFSTIINAATSAIDLWIAFKLVWENRPVVVKDLGGDIDLFALEGSVVDLSLKGRQP